MKFLPSVVTRVVLLAGLCLTSHAANITYQFAGVIKGGTYTPYTYFGAGATFEATAVFDPSAAATYNGSGGWGGQQTTRPLVSMNLTVHSLTNGDWSASSNNPLRNVDVLNDTYSDSVQFSSVGLTGPTVGGMTANAFNISFAGANTLLSSTAVPTGFSMLDWDPYGYASQTYMKIYLQNFNDSVTFRLTGVTILDGSTPTTPVNSVPDASATAPLLGLSLLAAALLKRRQAKA